MHRRHLLVAAAASYLAPCLARADAVLDALRRGGLIMLMRHAQTVPGTGDPPGFRLDDCATQRNLSEDGRAQARAIGARLRAERIPVGAVRTSAWCRCRETADLLDVGAVEPLPALNSFFEDRSDEGLHRTGILRFIESWKGLGNAMLVTHQVNITAVADVFPASGEIVVMSAGTSAGVLGRLRLWTD